MDAGRCLAHSESGWKGLARRKTSGVYEISHLFLGRRPLGRSEAEVARCATTSVGSATGVGLLGSRPMQDDEGDPRAGDDSRDQRRRFSRLGEQLTGLLDPESALRKGQGLVTGVTQATKDELVRLVSAETRSFLDGMDVADLLQQVIAGLTIDVTMQVKFSRNGDGPAQPEITKQIAKIRRDGDEEPAEAADEDEPSQKT